jgi:hypothetical protein
MTKHFGQDFESDLHPVGGVERRESLASKLLSRLFDFLIPVMLGGLALYIGRHGLG